MPLNVDYLEQKLEDLGYTTPSARKGQEALDKVTAQAPDLILLDVRMPIMDGFTVCHIPKGNDKMRIIPIAIMTALNGINDRMKGIEAGADDFLAKPINQHVLKTRTQTTLKLKQIPMIFLSNGGSSLGGKCDRVRQTPVIFLDLLIPRMDGFTLVEQLQQAPQPHQIPVILLKAKTLTAGDQAVLERSVRTVIQKRGLDDDTVIQELLGLLQAYRVSLPKDFVPPFAKLNGGRRSSGLQHPPASSVWMDVSHRSP